MPVPSIAISVEPASGWSVAQATPRARRAAPGDPFLSSLARTGRLTVERDLTATPVPRHRGARATSLTVRVSGEGAFVAAARHASGALTFHPVEDGVVEVPLAAARSARPARRSVVAKAVKIVLLKALGAFADRFLPTLARNWETAAWEKRDRAEGFYEVTASALRERPLGRRADLSRLPPPPARSLLFLHGLFSDGASCFGRLADTRGRDDQTLLTRLGARYEGRVFAYDHFTVSKTPEENARHLLESLPDRPALFDVVAHSRGGLVLRTLVERPSALGGLAHRFRLGAAALVAVPNEGSRLADPERWEETVGFVANLLELFPENPFSTGLELASEGLVWIARRAHGGLPGVAALAPDSPLVRGLRRARPLPAYTALGADFAPDRTMGERLADAGIDSFFGVPNDLAVPTAGCGQPAAPERVHVLGPETRVNHLTFFGSRATVDVLVAALEDGDGPPSSPSPAPTGPRRRAAAKRPTPGADRLDPFQLVLLAPAEPGASGQLLATHGSARVAVSFRTRGGTEGERLRRIIEAHERILGNLAGKPAARPLPEGDAVVDLGSSLFETLFSGDVRRLYDAARADATAAGRPLDVVFTSAVDWIADKPWELAYDPGRGAFLATDDVHFVRNVFTPVPAPRLQPRAGPLRILVAVAQPTTLPPLAVDDELRAIRRGFGELVHDGLARVEVVRTATPETLHDALQRSPVDVLHFIGHGEYDASARQGFLVFEDAAGAARLVDSATLRHLLTGRGLSLVFLNACETGRGGRADFNRGVAPALVAAGLPAVVANQYSVLDTAATAFSRSFYRSLARGLTLGAAAREARVAVRYAVSGESIDWAIPVLYARDASDRLARPRSGGTKSQAEHATRRAGGPSPRVGLCDLHGADLAPLLARLERKAPETFRDLTGLVPSAPLGTWHLRRRGNEAHGVIDAAELERRLAPRVAELGLAVLICLTRFPIDVGTGERSDHRAGGLIVLATEPAETVVERVLESIPVFR